MTTTSTPDWTEANQAQLNLELRRLKARLAGEDTRACERELAERRHSLPAPAAIDRLAEGFRLSPFERDLLLGCAGVQLDADFAACCAAASSVPGRFMSFGLALGAFAEPHWSALTPVRPLRLWRLLELSDEHAITTGRLNIDERILHYLAGVNYLDLRLRPLLRTSQPSALISSIHESRLDAIFDSLQTLDGLPPALQLLGDDPTGQRDVATRVAEQLGLTLHVLRASDIPSGLHELEALALLWHREALLLESALLIECGSAAEGAAAARIVDRCGGITFVAAPERVPMQRPSLQFPIERPGAADQKQLWQRALGSTAVHWNGALDAVALQFQLNAESITRASADLRARLEQGVEPDAALWQTCRAAVRSGLDGLAQRVDGRAEWRDLVLPEAQLTALRQIAAHVQHRSEVYEEWGFAAKGARGLGISALFAGESGTGKTMAAEVLANALQLDLYRIDLAATVSKYIGETEKNLGRVFDAAEHSGAILLFDEADALFGKRSEVNDSHDRHANIEVSYLLQRMESYRGLAILTTNQKSALDQAFLRRLRFVVTFPFPDVAQRERIWRGIFPDATPLDGVDPVKLAHLNVAGGNIRNIALNAAFLAAHAGEPVSMPHLLQAVRTEAAKRERPFSEVETRGWV